VQPQIIPGSNRKPGDNFPRLRCIARIGYWKSIEIANHHPELFSLLNPPLQERVFSPHLNKLPQKFIVAEDIQIAVQVNDTASKTGRSGISHPEVRYKKPQTVESNWSAQSTVKCMIARAKLQGSWSSQDITDRKTNELQLCVTLRIFLMPPNRFHLHSESLKNVYEAVKTPIPAKTSILKVI